MRKLLNAIALSACLASLQPAAAQSVGLVLSGGGAKGMAHIGVIKALEENHIPIDYVAGTSMGAIVGGMYAIGMSPDEMVALLKSDDFKRWSTGEVEQRYIYYYKNADPSPSVFNLRFHVDASHGIDSFAIRPVLPTNMISSVQMNYAFVELFMQANAVAAANCMGLNCPESILLFTFNTHCTNRGFEASMAIRHPGMLCALLIELSSMQTSLAPGIERMLSGCSLSMKL